MSFLKKHWLFAVPAVVGFCVILLGVVTLYSKNTPPEPKVVYVMPERSLEKPPVNLGGLPPAATTASNAPGSIKEQGASPRAPVIDVSYDVEPIEICCDEEFALADEYFSEESAEVIPNESLNAESPYSATEEANADFEARKEALFAQAKRTLADEQLLEETIVSLVANLPSEFHQIVRDRMAENMSPTEIDHFFDRVAKATPITPQQVHREYNEK